MKVKILHPIHGWAYFGGEVTEIPDARAAELVAQGHAIMIPDTIQEIEHTETVIRREETIKKNVHKK
jgi:hypothetical protein